MPATPQARRRHPWGRARLWSSRASAVILTILACCALRASAQALNLVFVCGEDLCSARGDGSNRVRQTRDGQADRFSSPSVSRSGKRIAFTRGERGRVYTARLARRNGAITRLRGLRRIPPFRTGSIPVARSQALPPRRSPPLGRSPG
jgi:hypothetical protein